MEGVLPEGRRGDLGLEWEQTSHEVWCPGQHELVDIIAEDRMVALVMATSKYYACISAGVVSVSLDDATVAVVLSVPPCAHGLEVVVPHLGVFSNSASLQRLDVGRTRGSRGRTP